MLFQGFEKFKESTRAQYQSLNLFSLNLRVMRRSLLMMISEIFYNYVRHWCGFELGFLWVEEEKSVDRVWIGINKQL